MRPANILVISNKEASPYEYLFKLANLGLSHYKITAEGEHAGTDEDTFGTQTYGKCFLRTSRARVIGPDTLPSCTGVLQIRQVLGPQQCPGKAKCRYLAMRMHPE